MSVNLLQQHNWEARESQNFTSKGFSGGFQSMYDKLLFVTAPQGCLVLCQIFLPPPSPREIFEKMEGCWEGG